ncbi:hypothetical protein GCM10020000_56610 [Streptomyces olivoverticillatus]
MRYAERSTACGTDGTSGIVSSTGSPARTVASTSWPMRATPGCGVRSEPPGPEPSSLRSTPSSRRISVSDSRAAAAIAANSSRAASGRSVMR